MTEFREATIMGKYSMPIMVAPEENGAKLERSFLNWIHHNRKFVSNHTFAACMFYRELREAYGLLGASIVEYFAGAGIHAVVAENIIHPPRHVCIDRNPLAVEQLQLVSKSYQKMEISRGSFEDWSDNNRDVIFDIHDLDNPCFTVAQLRHYHLELSRIFQTRPQVVKLTDIAGAKMGWNQKYFAKHFRRTFSGYDEYLHLTSQRIYDLFGYSAKFIYTYDRVAMMCLREGWSEPKITALPDEPSGFVIN